MLVLGLETASGQTGVAIGGPDGIIASFALMHHRYHVEALAPAIEFVCRQAGVELGSIDVVAVDVGPGLFTGLRVGLAAAKAIAYASGIGVVGVSSLEALAFPVRLSRRRIVSVMDALRNEIYHASYSADSEAVHQLREPRVGTPEELARELRASTGEWLLVGDGARRYAHVFAAVDGVEIAGAECQFPSPRALTEIGVAKAQRGEVVSESAVQITYLREPYIHSKRQQPAEP